MSGDRIGFTVTNERVLIVDDEEPLATILTYALRNEGYQVDWVNDGMKALSYLGVNRPDLIIMDIEMGRMDGLEATRRIMEAAPTSILVFSGISGEGRELTVEALAAGAVDLLSKPQSTDPREIERTLVERIDVARRVEEKVLHFPTARMEEIVRKVTDRELRLIVRLGYVLGAFIGLLMVAVDALVR